MVYKNSDMAYLIDEYCHSDRDRKVLRMLLLHDASVEEIAEKLDYSSRQMLWVDTQETITLMVTIPDAVTAEKN